MKIEAAAVIGDKRIFPESARRFVRAGAAFGEWSMYNCSIDCEKKPDKSELFIVGADYFRVYINGRFCAEYSVRSYIFKRAFEVRDVSDFVSEGKNTISVMMCETGEEKRCGFSCALRLIRGGNEEYRLPSWKTKKCDAVISPMTYTLSGLEEIYDSRLESDGWNSCGFDFSGWDDAINVSGVSDEPFTSLIQSRQNGQSHCIISPVKIIAEEKTGRYGGFDFTLAPSGNFCSAFINTFRAEGDVRFSVVTVENISEITLDGAKINQNDSLTVSSGYHTLAVASYGGGKPSFEVRTDGELAFSGWLFISSPKPKLPMRYAWNEPAPAFPVPEEIKKVMSAGSPSFLPKTLLAQLVPAETLTPGLWHELFTRKYISAPDGFCDSRLNVTPRGKTEEPIGLKNPDGLHSGGETVIPKSAGEVSIILDYGRERIGQLSFDVEAPAGTEIKFFVFEMIAESGIRYMGKGSCGKYVCRDGRHTFISNRRRGFRYLCLSVDAKYGDVRIHSSDVIETRYPAESVGAFSSDDTTLNAIYNISVDTAKVCMMDSYVDCPGFEQNTWTGDTAVTAGINMVNFGKREFDSRYLSMIGSSMDDGVHRIYRTSNPRYISGKYLPCACFPTYPEGGIPVWSFSWAMQVMDHYLYFGKDDGLEKNISDLKECFRRCRELTNDRGLLEIDGAWNLIEWADNDLMPCCEASCNSMMLSACLIRAAKMLRSLGRESEAAELERDGFSYRDAVNKYCWDEEQHAYVDTVRDSYAYGHYLRFFEEKSRAALSYDDWCSLGRISVQTNTFALLYDCADGERAKYCTDILLESVKTGDYISGTPSNLRPNQEKKLVGIGTPFFLYFVLKTLYKLGYCDVAAQVIRRDWGKMINDGFTTCVEAFRGKNGEWGRSVAHAWSASPAIFLMTEILGIKPLKPGYTEFSVNPHPSGLTRASGAVPTPYGDIYVRFSCENGRTDIFCRAPLECKRII